MSATVQVSGLVPVSSFGWLEELRLEHPRLVQARRAAVEAVAVAKAEYAELRAEYEAAVAEAARVGGEPPALPNRLEPEYARLRLGALRVAAEEAAEALKVFMARVSRAVGEHRLSEEWLAATAEDNDSAEAIALRRLEANWTWQTPRVSGPCVDELEAEVAAALAQVLELQRPMERRMNEWHEAVAARGPGETRPPVPQFDREDSALGNAMDRHARAVEAADRARRSGRVGVAA